MFAQEQIGKKSKMARKKKRSQEPTSSLSSTSSNTSRDTCEAKNVSHASPAARSYSKRSRYSSEKGQSISSKEEPKRKRTKLETSQKWSTEPKSASRYRDSSLNRPQDSKRSDDFSYEHQSFFFHDKGWKKKKEDDSRGDRRMCSSDVGQKRREKHRDYMDRKEEHPGAGYHRYLVIDSRDNSCSIAKRKRDPYSTPHSSKNLDPKPSTYSHDPPSCNMRSVKQARRKERIKSRKDPASGYKGSLPHTSSCGERKESSRMRRDDGGHCGRQHPPRSEEQNFRMPQSDSRIFRNKSQETRSRKPESRDPLQSRDSFRKQKKWVSEKHPYENQKASSREETQYSNSWGRSQENLQYQEPRAFFFRRGAQKNEKSSCRNPKFDSSGQDYKRNRARKEDNKYYKKASAHSKDDRSRGLNTVESIRSRDSSTVGRGRSRDNRVRQSSRDRSRRDALHSHTSSGHSRRKSKSSKGSSKHRKKFTKISDTKSGKESVNKKEKKQKKSTLYKFGTY